MITSKMALKAEELQNDVEKISSIQAALFEAIFNGDNAIEAYEWGFCALMELTLHTKNELQKLVNDAFSELKKIRKENEKSE